MEFLARFVGIWLVFVVYIAVDVEGVAYGAACTGSGTGDCTETTNIVCDTTCKCAPNFFRLTSSEACSAQIANLDTDACVVAETDPDQCAISGSECDNDGSTVQCRCKDTHYKDGTACPTRKALTETCTATPADQCILNAECTTLTCSCKTNFFENKDGGCDAVVPALNGGCDATDSATDQCAITDSECRVDGTAKCLCKATHFVDGSACTIRKNPEDTCSGDECKTHATCDTTCKCDAGYTASPSTNPTMCSGVVKFASLSYMYVVPILVSLMFLVR